MNKRKIVKNLRNESELMYSNVFNRVLDKLGVENNVPVQKKPWWKNIRFVAPISTVLATSLVVGIIVLTNGDPVVASADTAYINLTLTTESTDSTPAFSYSMDNQDTASDFVAKNDDAKIIAEGIDDDKKDNGLSLTKEIIKEATDTGYINNTSESNTITIRISSLSEQYQTKVATSLKQNIINYCKENYIYANIVEELVTLSDEQNLSEEKYDKIYKIYELAQIFKYDSNEEENDFVDPYYPSDDIAYWVEQFKDVENTKLDQAIEKLEMINQALQSDNAKNRFNHELQRIQRQFANGINYLETVLDIIEEEIKLTEAYLLENFNVEYGEVSLPLRPIINNEDILTAWEWLFDIESMNSFINELENEHIDYHYQYDDPNHDPFGDCFDYECNDEWEFEEDHHQPGGKPRWLKHPGDQERPHEVKDEEHYKAYMESLVELYQWIVDEVFDEYLHEYQISKERILANIYYQANDKNNNEYYVDYQEQYNEKIHDHGNHHDDEWEEWKNNYDDSWWR